jgi:hypothetical protein
MVRPLGQRIIRYRPRLREIARIPVEIDKIGIARGSRRSFQFILYRAKCTRGMDIIEAVIIIRWLGIIALFNNENIVIGAKRPNGFDEIGDLPFGCTILISA